MLFRGKLNDKSVRFDWKQVAMERDTILLLTLRMLSICANVSTSCLSFYVNVRCVLRWLVVEKEEKSAVKYFVAVKISDVPM